MSNDTQPEIRFSGFTEAWEQRNLGELAEGFEYGLNASAKKFDGSHKYIRITDIDDISHKFNQSGVITPDIDFTRADNYKLKKGDILFARTGASVGKTYMYRESDGVVYYAGFLIRARIKSKNSSDFVFQTTFTDSYNRFIKITSQRSGQPGVNAEEYSNFKSMIPNYEEQNAIGCFFKKIDDTITLHQRKLDLLKETKKGFLQKMFPKNGERVPEIRFPGFTEAWEERRLKDFIHGYISDGNWITKEHVKDGGKYRIIKIGNIGSGVYIDEAKSAKYIDQNSFDLLKGNEIFPGDLLISRLLKPYVKTAIIPSSEERMVTCVDVTIIRKNENFDAYFLSSQMNTSSILTNISKNISRTSIKRISRKNLEKVTINSTSIEEQQKIGTFFKQLDNLITLHQRKLDLLKETKKGFLQKMFV